VAALPWRAGKNGLEILLISSRETKRWVIPKGWPMLGRKPHVAAAREALEEAGVIGKTLKTSVGSFHYVKNLRNGDAILCRVEVFAMQVERQRKSWLERDQRITRWFPADEAASLVREPEFSTLIRDFKTEALEEKTKVA
jgi:8-oxo-dGTP pyrophosphatase MutT (NUDIX family)